MELEPLFTFIKKSPYMPFYVLALIMAIIRYPKYYNTPLKYFPIFILYTITNETLGMYVIRHKEFSLFLSDFYTNNNWLIFNIYNKFINLYFFYIFSSFINRQKYKKIILYGGGLYILASLINPFLEDFMLHPQTYAYLIGGITIIISVILYFKNHKVESQSIFGSRDILSWIGAGLLLFYLGYLPIKIIRNYNILNNLIEPSYIRTIHYGLIIIMYTFITIGFMRMKRVKVLS